MKNKLSFLGLGTWCFGDEENPSASDPMKNYWGGQKHSDSVRTIHAALRAGINHFDTAQVYGNGRSEQVVGQELRKIREQVIIADKFMPYSGDPLYIAGKVELSLRRLNTDYIDIMYIHWPVPGVENAAVTEALEKLREQGKIRYIGVSNFSCTELEDAYRGGNVDYCQVGYNFLWRRCEEDIVPLCLKHGTELVAYSFFAQGLLTGSRLGENDFRNRLVFCREKEKAFYTGIIRELELLAEENGVSVRELLLAWGRSREIFSSILVGCRNRKQLEENCTALSAGISRELTEKADALSRRAMDLGREYGNIFNHRTEVFKK